MSAEVVAVSHEEFICCRNGCANMRSVPARGTEYVSLLLRCMEAREKFHIYGEFLPAEQHHKVVRENRRVELVVFWNTLREGFQLHIQGRHRSCILYCNHIVALRAFVHREFQAYGRSFPEST